MKVNPKNILSPKFSVKRVTIRKIKNSIFTSTIFGVIGVTVLFAKEASYKKIYNGLDRTLSISRLP